MSVTNPTEKPVLPVTLGIKALLEDKRLLESLVANEGEIDRVAHQVQQALVSHGNHETIGGAILGIRAFQEAIAFLTAKGRADIATISKKSKNTDHGS